MKTVALIDPYSSGHHYAFIRLFAKYLLKNGNRVCIIYPEKEEEIKAYLASEGVDNKAIFFEKGSIQKKIIFEKKIWGPPLSTWRLWRNTSQLLRQTEKKHSIKFDFVFFAWLDDYLCNYLPHPLVDFAFNYKWSGLYFHPWYLNSPNINNRVSISSVDSVLQSRNCVSVAIHDEFNIQTLQHRIKKKVVLFPEIADKTTPENNYPLAQEIREKSKGRTIVGLIGISYRKGFPTFIETIEKSDPNKFFFFFCGPLETNQLPSTDHARSSRFFSALPSNCFYYPHYLEEGAKLNAIIKTFDVLFLVYNNFQSSSNFITKAALFKKLVISTDRFWMGRVTAKYKLGVTVKEGDTAAAVDGLISLTDNKHDYLKNVDWQGYLSIHREENLAQSMRDIMTF